MARKICGILMFSGGGLYEPPPGYCTIEAGGAISSSFVLLSLSSLVGGED